MPACPRRSAALLSIPVLLAVGLLPACTPRPEAPRAAPPPAQSLQPAVVLQRTECYGTCPAYTVSVFADGRVVFAGDRFVDTTGTAEGRVDPAVVAGLVAAAVRIGYETLPARLDTQQTCPQLATDNPSAITTVRTAGWTRSVAHDHGCRGFKGEKELTAFEDDIDRALGTDAWVGTP